MTNESSCSDSFPRTDVFYAEISDDVAVIVLLAVACVLTLIVLVIFLDEHLYLTRIHTNDPLRQRRVITLLGLYPMICVMALISLLVPASTQLVDLIASCYLSVCIYMFVRLMVEYFGGNEKMVEALTDDKIRMNTPPCCCCCCCLPKINLTTKSLYYIELLALQVAIIRPLLLFIAAVLWTDGKYVQGNNANLVRLIETAKGTQKDLQIHEMLGLLQPSTYLYGAESFSLLFSIYAQLVIFRAVDQYVKHQMLRLKVVVFNMVSVLVSLQNMLFGVLATFDVISCHGTRGSSVRASYISHAILIVEMFLLSMLARFAYRRPEPDSELTILCNGIPVIKTKTNSVDETNPDSASLYISIFSAISTLLSMYGMVVIFRGTVTYMQHRKLRRKFTSLQLTVVLSNVQPLIFGIIARYALECLGTRGPKVRASHMNHAVLVIEMCLLSLLARFAYRHPEPGTGAELDSAGSEINSTEKFKNEKDDDLTESGTVGKYTSYDNQAISLDEHSVEVKVDK